MEEKKTACSCGHDNGEHGCTCHSGDCEHEHKRVEHHSTGCSCGCDHTEHSASVREHHYEGGACGHDHQEPDHESHDGCGCGCGCGCGHDHGGKIEKDVVARLCVSLGLLLFGAVVPLPKLAWLAVHAAAYLLSGWEVLRHAGKNLLRGQVMDETFLMSLASLGACALGEWSEGVAVMVFYGIGELFQSYAVGRSRASITALMDIRPDTAVVEQDGKPVLLAAEEVPVGATLLVHTGERVALDGVILEGTSQMDTAALTGESLPREVGPGDKVLSGFVNLSGGLRVRVEKPFGESTASRILELTEQAAANKAKTEQFITRFARYYTPIVVGLAALIALVPPLLGLGTWSDFIHRALTFLVISCPCALVISVPMGFFAGIGCASRNGILVKGSNYLEALGQAKVVAFDKTGTLTTGTFQVLEVDSVALEREELLSLAALAQSYSNHPIAKSLKAAARTLDRARLGEVEEVAGHGVIARIDGEGWLFGNLRLMERHAVTVPTVDHPGTVVYAAREDGTYFGYILIGDTTKKTAARAIQALKTLGVSKTVMLTGDRITTAQSVGREMGIDEIHAGLLPGDKVGEVEKLLERKNGKGKVLFIGDGINDAPVLMRADVGVAMGGIGSDAAIESADVVLMDDDLSRLPTAIRIARRTHTVVTQNIIFAIGVKVFILLLGATDHTTMWGAVFADVGVCVLAVLNSMRALTLPKEE